MKKKLKQLFTDVMAVRKTVADDIKTACAKWCDEIEASLLPVEPFDVVSAIQTCIECLTVQEKLLKLGESIKTHYSDVFCMPMSC